MPHLRSRLFVTAGLLATALLLQGCVATTRLQPNRRLAPGETVGSVTFDLAAGMLPARAGLNVARGGEGGALLGGVGLGWDGFEIGGGGRLYLGPANLAVRLGLLVPLIEDASVHGFENVAGGWDVRLTTHSSRRVPFYAGLQTAGAANLETGAPMGHAGFVVGYEHWTRGVALQVEVGYAPLAFTEDGWGPTRFCIVECGEAPISGIELGIALHFGGDEL